MATGGGARGRPVESLPALTEDGNGLTHSAHRDSRWYNHCLARRAHRQALSPVPRRVLHPIRIRPTMTRTQGIAATLATMAVALAAGTADAEPAENLWHGFAPVNGTRLFYEVKGAGPAVVLIHGGQLDCRMWDGASSPLLPGTSASSAMTSAATAARSWPYMPYSDTQDLAAMLDYLEVDTAPP